MGSAEGYVENVSSVSLKQHKKCQFIGGPRIRYHIFANLDLPWRAGLQPGRNS
jgi:hypothetical protein